MDTSSLVELLAKTLKLSKGSNNTTLNGFATPANPMSLWLLAQGPLKLSMWPA